MSDEKKKYRVTNPVAWGGRRERGEILELTAEQVAEIGDVELIPEVRVSVEAEAEKPAEAVTPATGDYAPVPTADDEKAEAEKPAEGTKTDNS